MRLKERERQLKGLESDEVQAGWWEHWAGGGKTVLCCHIVGQCSLAELGQCSATGIGGKKTTELSPGALRRSLAPGLTTRMTCSVRTCANMIERPLSDFALLLIVRFQNMVFVLSPLSFLSSPAIALA